jgi:PilZ domain
LGASLLTALFPGAMHDKAGKSRRRYPRVQTPKGIWVAWQGDNVKQSVSRVSDLNLGGLFISTPSPAPMGTVLSVLLAVPEGEIRGRSTVRSVSAEGMGVEFTEIAEADRARLQALVARLLASNSSPSAEP